MTLPFVKMSPYKCICTTSNVLAPLAETHLPNERSAGLADLFSFVKRVGRCAALCFR